VFLPDGSEVSWKSFGNPTHGKAKEFHRKPDGGRKEGRKKEKE